MSPTLARVCSWSARDVLAGLVILVWGSYMIFGKDSAKLSPLEWMGGLGIVLGALAKFYGRPAPPPTDEGGSW